MNRTRSSSNARPNHIPLPPAQTGGFWNRSSPGTPTSPPGGTGSGNPLMTPSGSRELPSVGSASPRSSFLPSFMQRTRPRSSTLTRLGSYGVGTSSGNSSGSAQMGSTVDSPVRPSQGRATSEANLARSTSQPSGGPTITASPGPTHRIRLVPHLETSRSVHFEPVVRDLKPCDGPSDHPEHGTILRIGRFTERPSTAPQPGTTQTTGGFGSGMPGGLIDGSGSADFMGAGAGGNVTDPSARDMGSAAAPEQASTARGSNAGGGGPLNSGRVAFRSKVVSRGHAEIWVEKGGQFYLRDTSSSSGTFLNHIRLSHPTHLSRPFSIKDGDIIQLGVDYQGGVEEIYRCIKLRVEVGREKRGQLDNFNKEAMKQLKELGGVANTPTATPGKGKGKASVTDCCICLFSVTVHQALFIAPCSHVFHYKCIRPILEKHHPGFSCPLCRTFHDLEADVELEDAWEVASRRASAAAANRRESVADRAVTNGEADPSSLDSMMGTSDSEGPVESIANLSTEEDTEELAPSPTNSTRPQMSLGALPVPDLSVPIGNGNPNYAGLDAATPMNSTFLSTLADLPVASGEISRRSLENVEEDASAEVEMDEARRGIDNLYT